MLSVYAKGERGCRVAARVLARTLRRLSLIVEGLPYIFHPHVDLGGNEECRLMHDIASTN